MNLSSNWLIWAVLSTSFATLTAIFAKLGLEGIDSDYATLLRTGIILSALFLFVVMTGK